MDTVQILRTCATDEEERATQSMIFSSLSPPTPQLGAGSGSGGPSNGGLEKEEKGGDDGQQFTLQLKALNGRPEAELVLAPHLKEAVWSGLIIKTMLQHQGLMGLFTSGQLLVFA